MADIDRIRAKVTRAKQHIEDFQLRANVFYASEPYLVGVEDDLQRGKRLYRLVSVSDIPETLAGIASDALQNLRSPLDYLATQIETAACGAKPKHRVYFPIGRNATHYETVRKAVIKCSGQATIDAFDATEAYKGGAGEALWQLHELNKPDKHDSPLAVAADYRYDLRAFFNDSWRGRFPQFGEVRWPSLPVKPANPTCTLNVGDVLLVESLDVEVQEKREFPPVVAFHKPGVIECKPVLPTLQQFADLVSGVIDRFEPLLSP